MATCEEKTSPSHIYKYKLLEDVHLSLPKPEKEGQTLLTRGHFIYFHYGCDGVRDTSWGCGYRTLQTAISLIINSIRVFVIKEVPSIVEIQQILASIGDKPTSFVGSREWIGTLEEFYVIDKLFSVPCKIFHTKINDSKLLAELKNYFTVCGGFIMMGGLNDAASKGIAGIHTAGMENYLLVVDPHYTGIPKTADDLIAAGYVRWMHVNEFDNSYYNLCAPLLK